MSLSPFDHPILSGLFGDAELAGMLSAEADISAMVAFEVALAAAQAQCDVIPEAAAVAIARLETEFNPDVDALREGQSRDGVVVPELVKQMRAALEGEAAKALHLGATSQDVIDTSLVLRLKPICAILDVRLAGMIEKLDRLKERFGTQPLMARTRMQDALEITVADRLQDWKLPLIRHQERLGQISPRLLVLQFGGAVGTLNKFGASGQRIAEILADRLNLGLPEKSWHNQRDALAEFVGWLSLVSGSLGKIGQDVALMAQGGDIALSGGGGSSAMPHKSNPVAAETLVSLARYTAGASGTMGQTLVHEQERSGAAWAMEWLLLPQSVVATGCSLLLAARLVTSIEGMGSGARAG